MASAPSSTSTSPIARCTSSTQSTSTTTTSRPCMNSACGPSPPSPSRLGPCPAPRPATGRSSSPSPSSPASPCHYTWGFHSPLAQSRWPQPSRRLSMHKLGLIFGLLIFATQAFAQSAGWPPPAGAVAGLGVYNLSPPVLTTAQVGFLQLDANGNLRIAGTFSAAGTTSNASSGVATSSTNTPNVSYNYGFNGTTWDQLQVDASKNLKINCEAGCAGGSTSNASSGVATTSTNGATVGYNYGFNGTTWDQLQVDGSKNLKTVEASAASILTTLDNLIGVAGTPSAQVQSIQGVAGGTAVPVSGTFWQATQPVSGTFWQTTQPVSGTFWQTTQPVSIASMPSTPVTGTFWQTTQPVSGTFWQATQPVSGTVTATQATSSNLKAQVDPLTIATW